MNFFYIYWFSNYNAPYLLIETKWKEYIYNLNTTVNKGTINDLSLYNEITKQKSLEAIIRPNIFQKYAADYNRITNIG